MTRYIKLNLVPSRYIRAIGFMLMWLLVTVVWAEHEADHRYTVEGFVLDARENPRPDVNVVVTADAGPSGRTVTDRRGFYRIQLHLHNPDLGKRLKVKAGGEEAEIEVAFDPGDKTTARVHKLNFIGDRATETDLGVRGFPTWVYVVFAVIIVAIVARRATTAMKKRRKHRDNQQQRKNTKTRKKSRRKPRKN